MRSTPLRTRDNQAARESRQSSPPQVLPSGLGMNTPEVYPTPLPSQPANPAIRIASLALLLTTTLVLAACGSPGTPQAPSLKLPTPPTDLTAGRTGNTVTLHWTMPRRATDRVPLAGDQRAVICRALATTPCTPAAELLLAPGLPASYTDTLPAALLSGPPHLLIYTILLQNHRHRAAGPSNPAYTAAGAPPPPIAGLHTEATASGIALRWDALPPAAPASRAAPSVHYLLRLDRTRVLAPGESPSPTAEETRAGVPQPINQTLEVTQPVPAQPATLAAGWTLDHATDRNAQLNRTYRYTVERVARLTLDGHAVEVSSAPSSPATLVARDLFPPAIPQGLQAVADTEGGAIDLSWTPNSEADLAGYRVYRRNATASTPPECISGAALVSDAGWRDPAPQPGTRYAYSITAVDTSGNQSPRSAEVEERLDRTDKPLMPPIPPPHAHL
jgi:hypothetical protein